MAGHDIQQTTLANGLTVLVESMPAVRSAAFSLLIPAGSVFDPDDQNGTANALADWITRGAGSMSSRELLSALDRLGIQSQESSTLHHLAISGAFAGRGGDSLGLSQCAFDRLDKLFQREGLGQKVALYNEYEAICARLAEELSDDEMNQAVRKRLGSPLPK